MPDIQYRTAFEFRATDADDVPGFEGYASTFWRVDSYGTAMAPGSFRKTIKERGDKIPVLWNHNPDAPIGRHLAIKEDKYGLYVNVGIADDGAEGSTFLKRVRFGVPFGMSFGFQTVKDRAATEDDPLDFSQMPGLKHGDVRIHLENKYWESSPVTFASNEAATITAVRNEQTIDYLSTLIESMRAGTLTDEQTAQIEQLVAAYQTRAGAGDTHSTPEDEAQAPSFDLLAAAALTRGRLILGVTA